MHTNRDDLHISWTISGNDDDDDPELNDRDEYVYNLAGWLAGWRTQTRTPLFQHCLSDFRCGWRRLRSRRLVNLAVVMTRESLDT